MTSHHQVVKVDEEAVGPKVDLMYVKDKTRKRDMFFDSCQPFTYNAPSNLEECEGNSAILTMLINILG